MKTPDMPSKAQKKFKEIAATGSSQRLLHFIYFGLDAYRHDLLFWKLLRVALLDTQNRSKAECRQLALQVAEWGEEFRLAVCNVDDERALSFFFDTLGDVLVELGEMAAAERVARSALAHLSPDLRSFLYCRISFASAKGFLGTGHTRLALSICRRAYNVLKAGRGGSGALASEWQLLDAEELIFQALSRHQPETQHNLGKLEHLVDRHVQGSMQRLG